jgi:hypothetical protein
MISFTATLRWQAAPPIFGLGNSEMETKATGSEVTLALVCIGIQLLHIEDWAIALLNLKRQDGLQALDAHW